MATKKNGPPPISSKLFISLTSPSNLTAVLEAVADDEVTVVKYQAPWCRTCRAMAPVLDKQAKKYGDLNYYSLECYRNGKAAGVHSYSTSTCQVLPLRERMFWTDQLLHMAS